MLYGFVKTRFAGQRYDFNFNSSLLTFLRFRSCFNFFKFNVSIAPSHPKGTGFGMLKKKKRNLIMKHRMNFEGIQRYLEVFFPRIIWPQNTGADLGLNLVLKVYRPSTSGK